MPWFQSQSLCLITWKYEEAIDFKKYTSRTEAGDDNASSLF